MKDSPIVYVSMTVHRPPEIKKAKIKIDFNKSYSTFKQCCYEYEPFSKGFEPEFFICSYQPNIYLKPSSLFH